MVNLLTQSGGWFPSGLGLTMVRGSGASYDVDASALFARMTTPPSDTRKGQINTLIVALKAAGVWSKLDVLYILAAANAQAAGLNWINTSYGLTAVNSPTFTVDRGYAGDGSTSYLNTGWAPNNGVQFTQNAAHVGGWNRTSRAANATALLGARTGTANTETVIHPRFTADALFTRIADSDGSVANASSGGFFVGSRTTSTSRTSYRNGAAVGSAVVTSAASAPHAQPIYIGARNNNGTGAAFTSDEVAAASLGGTLSADEVLAYYNALQTYMTAVGA